MSAVESKRQNLSSKLLQQAMKSGLQGSRGSALPSWWTKPPTEAVLSKPSSMSHSHSETQQQQSSF